MAGEVDTRESAGQEQGGQSLLTPRQAEVVSLAQQGKSAKEIARILGISKRTVEEHFDKARQRTGAVNRGALIALVSLAQASAQIQPRRAEFQEQRGRPRVMTDDLIKAARELVETCSVAEMARKLSVSRTTLYVHMEEIKGQRSFVDSQEDLPSDGHDAGSADIAQSD